MNDLQKKTAQQVRKYLYMKTYMMFNLPMGFWAGLRVREFDENKAVVSVPFKNLNKNPFKSIYFAVQSMAAEMSTAAACLVAIQGQSPSVAFIIVDLKANFTKKASGRTYFTCEDVPKAFDAVEKCIESGESEQATFKTVGRLKDGTVVSEFEFTWSFKQRKS